MSSSTRSTPPPDLSAAEVLRLKRTLAVTRQELNEAQCGRPKRIPTTVTMGRGIRRLVSLFESVDGIISEADRRIQAEADGHEPIVPTTDAEIEEQEASERTYNSYLLLLRLVPRLKEILEDPAVDSNMFNQFITQLQRGANDGRSDDVRRVKEEVTIWINQTCSPPVPLNPKNRDHRGFQNDFTGRLLCPIEYSWDDLDVRARIRNGEIDISEDYFLTCLYPKGSGNPDDVEKYFLRSSLLLKTFCAIFTSPSSSDAFEEQESDDGPTRKMQKTASQKKATKSTVASLLHMEGKVTPRAIAYAATLLVFNLHDASQWVDTFNHFSFRSFYNFIIDFFESDSDLLFRWWNKQVFPDHCTTVARSQKSRNRLREQRRARSGV